MKIFKNNICTILTLVLIFSIVMIGDASAAETKDVFSTVGTKLSNLFKKSKFVLFLIGGFGLIALAFQAIFGKLKWAWFAALAFGLAVVAAAGGIVGYAVNNNGEVSTNMADTLT